MANQELTDDILREPEAAVVARESARTFRQRRYDGTGPRYLKIGARALYRRSAVLEWMYSHERASGAA
ncbi:hypothetical protein [Microbacterium sp. NPDC076911]|uniref:helix-turn-helix transcriptional regulator n=1 Tax=Microbacterium sp. NPDC076911 TaxID=3154958 RepID=UPI0034170A53